MKVVNSSINTKEYMDLLDSCEFSKENQRMIESVQF
jgi:hypothetical protein